MVRFLQQIQQIQQYCACKFNYDEINSKNVDGYYCKQIMSENIQKTSDEISMNAEFHRKMMFSQTSSKSSSSSSFAKKSLSSTSDTKPLKHTNSSFSMSSDLEDWSDAGVVEDWLAEDSEIITVRINFSDHIFNYRNYVGEYIHIRS